MLGSVVLMQCTSVPPVTEDAARGAAPEAAAKPAQDAPGLASVVPVTGKDPALLPLARVEGYGNPATGELWMRMTPVEPPSPLVYDGVAVQAHALQDAGYCEYPHSTTPDSMPSGGFEFWTHPEPVDPFDAFNQTLCEARLPTGADDRPAGEALPDHSTVFSSMGVGCAYQRVGNYTGRDFSRVLLDIDVFNGEIDKHGPYGWPYAVGEGDIPGSVPTPDTGRNRPYQDLGLWDFGPLADGETADLWLYFQNGDSNNFNWTGYLLGEVFEDCGNNMDDDCDGVVDNGCGEAMAGQDCYTENDCGSGSCTGNVINSGLGEGGGSLADDVAGTCDVVCGDTLVEGSESCDDGNTDSDDGCDGSCQIEPDCYPPLTAADFGSYSGSTVGADDDHGGACSSGTGEDVIYEYTAHHYGKICVDTFGSSFDTQLHLRSACAQPATEYACNDDDGGLQSRIQTTVSAGDQVFAVVDGTAGAAGDYTLNIAKGSCCPDGYMDVNGDGSLCEAFSFIAAGYHSCGITTSGRLYCWGDNNFGKLGDGTTIARAQPTEVSGGYTDWQEVVVGYEMSCGVRGGRAFCWGRNFNGKLGDGTTTDRLTPTEVSGSYTDFHDMALGTSGSSEAVCALRGSGTLWCWGSNGSGRFGNGNTTSTSVPVIAGGSYTDWVRYHLGNNHSTCGVRSTGQGYCWGHNGNSQLGIGGAGGTYTSPTEIIGSYTDWQDIAVATYNACGVRGGAVYCWGSNGGSFGNNTSSGETGTPTPASGGISDFEEIDIFGSSVCARRSTGQLYCWGTNGEGQGGNGTTDWLGVPTEVSGGHTDWGMFALGSGYTCGMRSGGTVYCWGSRRGGQALSNNAEVPSEVVGGHNTWQDISASGDHTCGVRDGRVYCWGNNDNGQIGNGASYGSVTTPTEVTGGFTDWTEVETGTGSTCGLRGSLAYCWGPAANYLDDPTLVPGGFTDWDELSVGYGHACGLRGGRLFCWGSNGYGELGDGTTTTSYTPVEVAGSHTDWEHIATGSNFNCAVRQGRLYCWGYNYYGALGDGTTTARSTPTEVSGGHTDWESVSGGDVHACGRRSSMLFCWGYNASGQLGDNSVTNRFTPVEVSGAHDNWGEVKAGGSHTCAKRSGRLHCWGYNYAGQLGINSNVQQLVPVLSGLGYADWSAFGTGYNHSCGLRGGRAYCWGQDYEGQVSAVASTGHLAPVPFGK